MSVKRRYALFVFLVIGSMALSSCGTQAVSEVETVVEEVEVTRIVAEKETVIEEVEVTRVVTEKETVVEKEIVEITPVPPAPAVGGTLVWALNGEPDFLDAHKTNFTPSEIVLRNIGATLVTLDPNNNYVPWLAESWTSSPDGLTWDFKLREGITFHDGSVLDANAWVWTLTRAIDPEMASPGAGVRLALLESAEAVDDYTLRLHLKQPYWALLYSLTLPFCQPLPKDAVERLGDQFSRQPIGVGPYKFVEWQTGDHLTIERNPDYDWRPPFLEGGPYIERITYRFISEQATVSAGLETGAIDFGQISTTELNRFYMNPDVTIFPWQNQGQLPYMLLNNSRFPFDDLRVRQALNYATDREELVEVVTQGTAAVSYGPLSENQIGYWQGEKDIAYGFDLAKAEALMQDAGFTMGSDGVLQKDGQSLSLTVFVPTNREMYMKAGQVLQEQWARLGVALTLEARDSPTVVAAMRSGDYDLLLQGYGGADADQLVSTYGSKNIQSNDYPQVQDKEALDELMLAMRTTLDPEKHQEAVTALGTHIIDQAYVVWLFNLREFWSLSNRIKGAAWSDLTGRLWLLGEAYIETQ